MAGPKPLSEQVRPTKLELKSVQLISFRTATPEEASRVSAENNTAPLLDAFYHAYLHDETAAHFVYQVSKHYTQATLARLAARGSQTTRRAAVLAVGFLGRFENNDVLGQALHDSDRVVRMLAENSIREIWVRDGSVRQQHWLQRIMRLNNCGRFEEVVREATQLIDEADGFAEAWNQRAIAYFQMERYSDSIHDCRHAIQRNAYHFPSGVGMGHCYLEMLDASAALECFRWSLEVNPDMENVRAKSGICSGHSKEANHV